MAAPADVAAGGNMARWIDGAAMRAAARHARAMAANRKAVGERMSVRRSPPKRRAADLRRPLHDDEAGALQVLHKALGDDLRHDLVGVVDALAALVSKRIGQRRGQVGRVGGRELVGVGHRRTIAEARERSKNMRGAIVLVAMLLAPPGSGRIARHFGAEAAFELERRRPMMSKLAEVIAAAFSSGLSWPVRSAGKEVYCPPPGLKGGEAMSAFERFLADHPDMAERPYGDAMAATLSRAFPWQAE